MHPQQQHLLTQIGITAETAATRPHDIINQRVARRDIEKIIGDLGEVRSAMEGLRREIAHTLGLPHIPGTAVAGQVHDAQQQTPALEPGGDLDDERKGGASMPERPEPDASGDRTDGQPPAEAAQTHQPDVPDDQKQQPQEPTQRVLAGSLRGYRRLPRRQGCWTVFPASAARRLPAARIQFPGVSVSTRGSQYRQGEGAQENSHPRTQKLCNAHHVPLTESGIRVSFVRIDFASQDFMGQCITPLPPCDTHIVRKYRKMSIMRHLQSKCAPTTT
ncbi:hypothetical protein [Streptomyces cacaoi]|uniref:hypothetical protein n=1 Tax=Streptomyces cacaoi TaxID=1898 RepID=UPI003748AED0